MQNASQLRSDGDNPPRSEAAALPAAVGGQSLDQLGADDFGSARHNRSASLESFSRNLLHSSSESSTARGISEGVRQEFSRVFDITRTEEANELAQKLVQLLGIYEMASLGALAPEDLFPDLTPLSNPDQFQKQLELLGSLYLIHRMVDESPITANLLKRYLEHEQISYSLLRSKLENFYRKDVFAEGSALNQALSRELENKAVESETYVLGGVLCPLLDLGQRGLRGMLVQFRERYLQPEVSPELRDLDDKFIPKSIELFLRSCVDFGSKRALAKQAEEIRLLERTIKASAAELGSTRERLKLLSEKTEASSKREEQAIELSEELDEVVEGLKAELRRKEELLAVAENKLAEQKRSFGSAAARVPGSAPPRFIKTMRGSYDQELANDFSWQSTDPDGYRTAQEKWQRRIFEAQRSGFTVGLSMEESLELFKKNVFPQDWFKSDANGHRLVIPPGAMEIKDEGWGKGGLVVKSNHQGLYQFGPGADFARMILDAITNLGGSKVEPVPRVPR